MTVTNVRPAGTSATVVTEELMAEVTRLQAVVSAGRVEEKAEEIHLLLRDHGWAGFTLADVKEALATLASRGGVAWGQPRG